MCCIIKGLCQRGGTNMAASNKTQQEQEKLICIETFGTNRD